MNKLYIVVFIFTLLLMNCKKKTTAKTFTPACSGSKSFANEVKPLLQSYCVSCHSTYSTYSNVKSSSSSIRSLIVNGSMPKNTTLSDDQKNSIVCWIDAGALNN